MSDPKRSSFQITRPCTPEEIHQMMMEFFQAACNQHPKAVEEVQRARGVIQQALNNHREEHVPAPAFVFAMITLATEILGAAGLGPVVIGGLGALAQQTPGPPPPPPSSAPPDVPPDSLN